LDEVNARLARDGHRIIGINDPEMAERYGLAGYEGGFIQHYIAPLVYPGVMPERWGLIAGFSVLIWSVVVYTLLVVSLRRRGLHRAGRISHRGRRRLPVTQGPHRNRDGEMSDNYCY